MVIIFKLADRENGKVWEEGDMTLLINHSLKPI